MRTDTRPAKQTVDELNAASGEEFVAAMAPLFEGAPHFLGRLAGARPYRDEEELFERAAAIALAMPEAEQIELLDAHPRIGAPPGSVSSSSYVEQGYAADAHGGAAELERRRVQSELDDLNARYEARFGFRFVIYVAGRPRVAIVPLLGGRLANERREELKIGLHDVIAIAHDRWNKQREAQ